MKPFSDKIKSLRIQNGLTTFELGQIIGVSDSSICNWENGINDIKSEYLIKMSLYFKVSTDFLLGLEDNKENN